MRFSDKDGGNSVAEDSPLISLPQVSEGDTTDSEGDSSSDPNIISDPIRSFKEIRPNPAINRESDSSFAQH